jgi:hypothetical protein
MTSGGISLILSRPMGWGGNPDKDATYLAVTSARNDGAIVYRFKVGDVPVHAFWSVSVYNA